MQALASTADRSVDELRASLASKREALHAAAAALIEQPAEMRDWFNMPASRIVTRFDSSDALTEPVIVTPASAAAAAAAMVVAGKAGQ